MKRTFLILLITIVLMTNGCAVFYEENTPTLNWSEKHLVPENTGAKIAAAPLTIPAGLTAVTLDAVVVNPAMAIDDSAQDVGELLWDDLEWNSHYLTECAFLPLRTAVTPPAFSLSFFGRSFFKIDDRARKRRQKGKRAARRKRAKQKRERKQKKARSHVEKGYGALANGNFDEAMQEAEAAQKIRYGSKSDSIYDPSKRLKARVYLKTGRYQKINSLLHRHRWNRSDDMLDDPGISRSVLDILKTADPAEAARLIISMGYLSPPEKLAPRYAKVLARIVDNEEEVVALQVLHLLYKWSVFQNSHYRKIALHPALYTIMEEQSSSSNATLKAAACEFKEEMPEPEKPDAEK